jgi:hypothetical protein
MDSKIQDKLNKYCIINRKYNLFNESHFFSKFSSLETEYLKRTWENSFKEI